MALDEQKLLSLHAALASRYARLQNELERDDEALFRRVPNVSEWSVAKQLHHTAASTALMLVAVDRIAKQVSPAEENGSINTMGRALLLRGRFPRGRAKAPKISLPPEELTRDELEADMARSRRAYDRTPEILGQAAASGWRTKHPYFGMLDAGQWLKLARIHADHHLAIIDDIDAAK